jgi:hypothetical protein
VCQNLFPIEPATANTIALISALPIKQLVQCCWRKLNLECDLGLAIAGPNVGTPVLTYALQVNLPTRRKTAHCDEMF